MVLGQLFSDVWSEKDWWKFTMALTQRIPLVCGHCGVPTHMGYTSFLFSLSAAESWCCTKDSR